MLSKMNFRLSYIVIFLCMTYFILFNLFITENISAASGSTLTGTITSLPITTKTPTTTLLPLPTLTLQFPKVTATEGIYIIEHSNNQVPPKDSSSSSFIQFLVKMLPLGVLIVIWSVLGVWFLISQYLANKNDDN